MTRRTLPFGGAGAVEALLPFALSWTGISLAAAVLAVFAYRVFNLWLPLVPAALGATAVGVLLDTVAPALGADRLLVTHRDGPGGLGAAVSASIRSKLPISFTATGNAWGLRPADPYELAGLVVQ